MHESMSSLFSIKGKKALVTGGTLGIGRACATALAMGGADVAIVGRDEKVGPRTAESIREHTGVDAIFFQCDVSEQRQVQMAVSRTVERFGRLDIAVNSAGVVSDDWDAVIRINLSGLWYCA